MRVALRHKKATYARCIAVFCGSCENLDYRTAIIQEMKVYYLY